MKTPITTSLSIMAVLVAGVAAAVVNTQALQARSDLPIGDAAAVATSAPLVAGTQGTSPETITIVEEVVVEDEADDEADESTAVATQTNSGTTVGKTSTSTNSVQGAVTPTITYNDDDDDDDDDDDHEEDDDDEDEEDDLD